MIGLLSAEIGELVTRKLMTPSLSLALVFLILEKKTDTLLHRKTKVVLLLIHIEVKGILFELVFLLVSEQKLAHSVTSVAILPCVKTRCLCLSA
jgi:hypothetical protein